MIPSSRGRRASDHPSVSRVYERGSVLVVSESQHDSSQISHLLELSGYRTQLQNDLSKLHEHCPDKSATGEHFIATVLCHRRLDRSRPIHLMPERLPGRRVVVLTDCDAEQTVVSLLENGAHHVFNFNEPLGLVQARLEAALRYHHRVQDRSFSLGDIHFDVQKRRVSRSGKLVDLSPKEYELAYYLFSNRERVVGNSELMTSIWSLPPTMDTRRIDTAACRLRKKLNLSAHSGWELKRLRSIGYRLVESQQRHADSNFSAAPVSAVAS